MPQMAPMTWLIFLLFLFFMFSIVNSIIFFLSFNYTPTISIQTSSPYKKWYW